MEYMASRVNSVFMNCLYQHDEISAMKLPPWTQPSEGVLVEGLRYTLAFHPLRLQAYRAEVIEFVQAMDPAFHSGSGGGSSFLNLCMDKDGEQWGEHRECDQLLCLALACGFASYLMPREFWSAMPGGLPYIVFSLPQETGLPS